jgi:hypothetical protein
MFIFIDIVFNPYRDLSFYLFIPLMMSATQNIYLGVFAPWANSIQIQVMTINNFSFALGVILILLVCKYKIAILKSPFYVLMIAIGIISYSLITYLIWGKFLIAALASFRNIITPIFFFLFGLLASKNTSSKFFNYIFLLGWFVILFGFVERFIIADIWKSLNIDILWTKKGLSNLTQSGIPKNFYSSELILGKPIRRMVSSYADAVNFGTVLFFIFMVAWFQKKKLLMIGACIAILAAVSKGAFLGLLIFMVVWAYHYADKILFILSSAIATLLGVGFVLYSWFLSTRSLFIHVYGFLAAVRELPEYPLGRGLGNVGILARQLGSKIEISSGVEESGFGMIIGQIGIVGLVLYIIFIVFVIRGLLLLPKRTRVLSITLLLAILINIAFNEVALSPNSSAGYFIVLGLVYSNASEKQH